MTIEQRPAVLCAEAGVGALALHVHINMSVRHLEGSETKKKTSWRP